MKGGLAPPSTVMVRGGKAEGRHPVEQPQDGKKAVLNVIKVYREILLTRKRLPLGLHGRPMPWAL